ncbi:MAG: hypothetical protein PHH16_00330 [Candidatus Gracilibacteria bacterium]|nr:hypothetical protein [Candidatus Gracilibacteria bacterium]
MVDTIHDGDIPRSEEEGAIRTCEEQIHQMIHDILRGGEFEKIRRLERTLQVFMTTLKEECSVSPRIAKNLNEEIIAHPDFQKMLLRIVLTSTKIGRIEEFLRISIEYPTIFHIRELILQDESVQKLLEKRLKFMEENGQDSTAEILRRYIR